MTPQTSAKLQQRGIDASASRMGWRDGRNGWEYPVLDTTGASIGKRFKAYNSSAKPKYYWIQDLPTKGKGFYHVGAGLTDAIAAANGVLYFVNGEPAVLTMLAAGMNNAVCVFGEGTYPETISSELTALGVSKVVYFADKDTAGNASAAKLVGMLADCGINVECRSMLNTMPAKSDVNDLWQAVRFNADAFKLALAALPIFAPIAKRETKSLADIKAERTNSDSKWVEWVSSEVLPAVERAATGRKGKHFLCLNPDHDDHHPSARVTPRGVYVCTCGNHSMKTVAGWLNLDFKTWVQAKYPEAPKSRPNRDKQAESIKLEAPAQLAPFTADRTFNTRYVNQAPAGVLDSDCIALKSPTGSGKSKWAAEATIGAPSLLTIAFRQSLVRAQADNYGALAYDAIDGRDSYLIASADRVSTTIDSLFKFSNRVFDTLIIDEWVSALGHLSSAGTLKEKGAFAWDLLKRLIATARRVIVMDAHLTDDSLAELKALRGDLICVENTYTQPKVQTQILPNRLAFFSTALNRIKSATAPVLLGVTSPAEARLTKDLIEQTYPGKRVMVITKNQSHLIEVQSFIRSINAQLSKVDVLIFNGAMSTGVDIQADVDSIICLIDRPLSPADGVQMLGRARNAQMRFARVPDTIEGLDCNAAEMFQTLEYAANLSRVETSKTVRMLARLRARHETRRNAEMSNFLPIFRAYCHADGSDTQAAIVRFDKAIADKIKAIREAHTTQRRADTLATDRVPTVTPEILDSIRQAGEQEITPGIDAGYLRHKIESATGQAINECLYDKYHTRAARATLYRVDISTSNNSTDIDQRENAESLPLHQRTNATGMKALFNDGLRALGATNLDELPNTIMNATAENLQGFSMWAIQNSKRFEALLGYRGGHDGDLSDDVKAVRYFLKRFGVTLDRKQIMRDGKRFYVYSVDAQEIAELTAIIAQRRLKASAERAKENYFKTAKYTSMPFRSNRNEGVKTAPPTAKTNAGASRINPFSRSKTTTEAA